VSAGPLLKRAREAAAAGESTRARGLLNELSTTDSDLMSWLAVDRLLAKLGADGARRTVRLAVLSSHTGAQLTAAIRVAGAVHGLVLTTYESDFRTFEQEILDVDSGLYAFAPDVVLLAADQREVNFPEVSDTPEKDLSTEVARWRQHWATIGERTKATIVHLTFVPPLSGALGQHGAVHPGGRRRQLRRLNLALSETPVSGVHLVDAEDVAYDVGRAALEDPRYWFRSKHAIGLGATTAMARAIADILAASLGLARKLVVVDLDNTLWGGVIGEDGLGGIALGDGPVGEAFVAFQHFLSDLRQRGIVLAVCSKNNPDDARLPFQQHPDMVLSLEDFVAFRASWDPKPKVLRQIADDLDLGLESVVFVDDNPAERDIVRQFLPEVGVVELPRDPQGYVPAMAQFPGLQTVSITEEDQGRTRQYQSRAEARSLQSSAGSLEAFLSSLSMTAEVEPLQETNRHRMVQLIGKTNQFNLTVRRHGAAEVERLDRLDRSLVWGLRLTDRFDTHGLVSVLIAAPDPCDDETLVIDTFVMSCRVLGRTVERALLASLTDWAADAGYRRVVGHYAPSGRNVPAAEVLPEAGFRETAHPPPEDLVASEAGPLQAWEFVIGTDRTNDPGFIDVALLSPLTA